MIVENCPAKKVVAGKVSEGEAEDWEGAGGSGVGGSNGKIIAVGGEGGMGKGFQETGGEWREDWRPNDKFAPTLLPAGRSD